MELVKPGAPILREVCEPVSVVDETVREFLDGMVKVCENAIVPAFSLAANQVGINKRLIVIFANEEILKLANPVIVKSSGKQRFLEACFSVGLGIGTVPSAGFVDRPAYIEVEAVDYGNNPVSIKAIGLMAVMLQHEIDHLDGILYTDKIVGDLINFNTIEERMAFREEHPLEILEEALYESTSDINKLVRVRNG